MKKIISTERAPKAIGPYSQAVISNGWAFLSGQIPLDPGTNQIVEGGMNRRYRPASGRLVQIPLSVKASFQNEAARRAHVSGMAYSLGEFRKDGKRQDEGIILRLLPASLASLPRGKVF